MLDVRGGGQPPVYFHHCSLVNDILSLESQLDRLRLQLHHVQNNRNEFLAGDIDPAQEAGSPSSAGQRFVTMSDQSPGKPSSFTFY